MLSIECSEYNAYNTYDASTSGPEPTQLVPHYGIQTTFWTDNGELLHTTPQGQTAADLARSFTANPYARTQSLQVENLRAQPCNSPQTPPQCTGVPYHKGRWAREQKPPRFVGVPRRKGRWSTTQSPSSPPGVIGRPGRSRSSSTSSTVSSIPTPTTPPLGLTDDAKIHSENVYWASMYQGPPMLNKTHPRASRDVAGSPTSTSPNLLLASLLAGVSRRREMVSQSGEYFPYTM